MSKLFLLTILIFCGFVFGFSANGQQDIEIENPDFSATSFGVPEGYYFLIEKKGLHEPNPVWGFLILKQYTYGEITIIFELGLIWITLLIYVLKKLFTKEKVFAELRRAE